MCHPDTTSAIASGSPQEVIAKFTGIAYRADGAINSQGEFTLFGDQQLRFDAAGLNCSGFVVAASRDLFARTYPLNEVVIDRAGDSGSNSTLGADWDFGYDLILNLTEGMERTVLLPYGRTTTILGSSGANLRGFALNDRQAWDDVLAQMQPNYVYLFSLSKTVQLHKYRLLHYHVGIIIADGAGQRWLAQATTQHGVTMVDIAAPLALQAILAANPDCSLGKRMILIIAAPLP